MAYQPMLELLAYLRANDFKTFIVSGSGIEFMRAFAEKVYGTARAGHWQQRQAAVRDARREARDRQAGGRGLHRRQGWQTDRHSEGDWPTADRGLRQLRRRPADAAVDVRSIENAISSFLPHGKACVEDVARALGMSQRTLARRLSAEGLTFSRVLDAMRTDLADHYLRDATLSVSQVAWLLGFQEVSAFTFAFKRWTGQTPSQFRLTGRSGAENRLSPRRATPATA